MDFWYWVTLVWNGLMWPTGWPFPFGAIMSIVYLYVFYRLYRRFVPECIQKFLYSATAPLIRTVVHEVRGVLGTAIAGQTAHNGTNTEQRPIYIRRSWRGAFGWWLFGVASILSWQYSAWPYIRPALPF